MKAQTRYQKGLEKFGGFDWQMKMHGLHLNVMQAKNANLNIESSFIVTSLKSVCRNCARISWGVKI